MITTNANGSLDIVIGDEDVLTGVKPFAHGLCIWFAPLEENHGLTIGEPLPATGRKTPPDDAVAQVIILNRKAAEALIKMLCDSLDTAFPQAKSST